MLVLYRQCLGEARYAYSVIPEPRLRECLARLEPRKLRVGLQIFQHNGREYMDVSPGVDVDNLGGAIPSSGPAYIYDRNGNLVDWVDDGGDGAGYSLSKRWGDLYFHKPTQPVSFEQARAWLDKKLSSDQLPPAMTSNERYRLKEESSKP